MKRAIFLKEKQGRVKDIFFSLKKGRRMKLKDLEGRILDRLTKVQIIFLVLISSSVDDGLPSSFKRRSTFEAINRGVVN